jgi:hypothetical protein
MRRQGSDWLAEVHMEVWLAKAHKAAAMAADGEAAHDKWRKCTQRW